MKRKNTIFLYVYHFTILIAFGCRMCIHDHALEIPTVVLMGINQGIRKEEFSLYCTNLSKKS